MFLLPVSLPAIQQRATFPPGLLVALMAIIPCGNPGPPDRLSLSLPSSSAVYSVLRESLCARYPGLRRSFFWAPFYLLWLSKLYDWLCNMAICRHIRVINPATYSSSCRATLEARIRCTHD